MEILKSFLLQILLTIGVIVIFGYTIALIRRAFCRITGRAGSKILLATGIVGTPIHELSHAVMCIIFGHKIKQIKLYQPNSTDGALGYVTHSYNKRNVYHLIGNFFIGIAPIICGNGVILLLMRLIIPDISSDIWISLEAVSESDVSSYFVFIIEFLKTLFDPLNFDNALFWVFIVLAIMISSHMELSGADIKNGASGFAVIAAILLTVDVLFFFISPDALISLNLASLSLSLAISGFLTVSVIFLLIMLIIALIIKGISEIFK